MLLYYLFRPDGNACSHGGPGEAAQIFVSDYEGQIYAIFNNIIKKGTSKRGTWKKLLLRFFLWRLRFVITHPIIGKSLV